MQISNSQLDESSLAALGKEAGHMLCKGDMQGLAQGFGYALAFDRQPSQAIQDDLLNCLAEQNCSRVTSVNDKIPVAVKHFKQNDSNLDAVIECHICTDKGTNLLIELVVTSKGTEKFVTLEQISHVP